MQEELDDVRRTQAIEKVYNRAVNEALAVLEKARIEAKTFTKVNTIIETQQAFISRLTELHNTLSEKAQNPLGNFNWDFA